MIERQLKEITEEVLRELISEGASEGKTLEFKRSLSVDEPEGKLKFLRGIASFANASGGDMVFGIVASKEGKAENLVRLENFNPDRDVLRLRDIIRMNVEPRGVFFDLQPVELAAGGYALVIRIQKSWAGAHFVTQAGDLKFFTRDHGGRRPMDIPEIRNAFTLAEGVVERINRFRLERTSSIIAEETPQPLLPGGRIVLHLCPLSSFQPGKRCNLSVLPGHLYPIYSESCDGRYDLEGYYSYRSLPREETSTGYTLVSHSGWIEAVDSSWLRYRHEAVHPLLPNQSPPKDVVYTRTIERELMQTLTNYFATLKLIGADAPAIVMLSFINVRGFLVDLDDSVACNSARRIARDNLLIPGSLVESLDVELSDRTKVNALDVMRPMFDALWNACGLPRSRNFDKGGNWYQRP